MDAVEINNDDWGRFCARFSREHQGWLVSVGVISASENKFSEPDSTEFLAHNLPLQEIREAQNKDQVEIMITVGNGAQETSFLVENVAGVFETLEEDKHLGMRIDSTNAPSTIIQFRSPANPYQLDGLTNTEI